MRTLPSLVALACLLAPAASWAAAAGDASHEGRRAELREKVLAKFDANHDGKLDEGERAAAKAACQQHREERQAKLKAKHPELFAKIDTNNDGTIERDEAKAWRKEHGKHEGHEGRKHANP